MRAEEQAVIEAAKTYIEAAGARSTSDNYLALQQAVDDLQTQEFQGAWVLKCLDGCGVQVSKHLDTATFPGHTQTGHRFILYSPGAYQSKGGAA